MLSFLNKPYLQKHVNDHLYIFTFMVDKAFIYLFCNVYDFMVAGTKRQAAVSTERNYFRDAGLEKLALPVKTRTNKDNVVLEEIPLKVPNNNPFKRKKLDEIQIAETKDTAELVALKGGDEKLEISCVFSDSSFMSGTILEISNQIESSAEQISMVTEVESSEALYINTASQESISSKPKQASNGRGRSCLSEKLKRSNSKNSETKSSILNFFARV